MQADRKNPQWASEVCRCSRCGGEIYRGEDYYCVDGLQICEDCLRPFAAWLLRPYRRVAGEMEVTR